MLLQCTLIRQGITHTVTCKARGQLIFGRAVAPTTSYDDWHPSKCHKLSPCSCCLSARSSRKASPNAVTCKARGQLIFGRAVAPTTSYDDWHPSKCHKLSPCSCCLSARSSRKASPNAVTCKARGQLIFGRAVAPTTSYDDWHPSKCHKLSPCSCCLSARSSRKASPNGVTCKARGQLIFGRAVAPTTSYDDWHPSKCHKLSPCSCCLSARSSCKASPNGVACKARGQLIFGRAVAPTTSYDDWHPSKSHKLSPCSCCLSARSSRKASPNAVTCKARGQLIFGRAVAPTTSYDDWHPSKCHKLSPCSCCLSARSSRKASPNAVTCKARGQLIFGIQATALARTLWPYVLDPDGAGSPINECQD